MSPPSSNSSSSSYAPSQCLNTEFSPPPQHANYHQHQQHSMNHNQRFSPSQSPSPSLPSNNPFSNSHHQQQQQQQPEQQHHNSTNTFHNNYNNYKLQQQYQQQQQQMERLHQQQQQQHSERFIQQQQHHQQHQTNSTPSSMSKPREMTSPLPATTAAGADNSNQYSARMLQTPHDLMSSRLVSNSQSTATADDPNNDIYPTSRLTKTSPDTMQQPPSLPSPEASRYPLHESPRLNDKNTGFDSNINGNYNSHNPFHLNQPIKRANENSVNSNMGSPRRASVTDDSWLPC